MSKEDRRLLVQWMVMFLVAVCWCVCVLIILPPWFGAAVGQWSASLDGSEGWPQRYEAASLPARMWSLRLSGAVIGFPVFAALVALAARWWRLALASAIVTGIAAVPALFLFLQGSAGPYGS